MAICALATWECTCLEDYTYVYKVHCYYLWFIYAREEFDSYLHWDVFLPYVSSDMWIMYIYSWESVFLEYLMWTSEILRDFREYEWFPGSNILPAEVSLSKKCESQPARCSMFSLMSWGLWKEDFTSQSTKYPDIVSFGLCLWEIQHYLICSNALLVSKYFQKACELNLEAFRCQWLIQLYKCPVGAV